MSSEHKWWFALVGASPNPEAEEHVNVALLIGNGRMLRLEYNEGLQRAKCIAGPVEIRLLSEALSRTRKELSRFEDLLGLRQYLGPQVRISDPRPLFRSPDRDTIRLLKRKYLGEAQKRRAKRVKIARVAKIDETIRTYMSKEAFGLHIEKRVKPSDLFQFQAREIFSTKVPSFDRAIRSSHRDLLLGGITIDPRRPMESMRAPGLRLGRAFWHYKEAKNRILEITGREVRTVGLIYNGVKADDRAAREALEYVAHVWSQDADAVLRADDPVEGEKFGEEVAWLGS
ncbi:MAG: hypothetical protein GF347_00470 [Candidatus Moranbacteria bacterium]|nr:hypothetical protein [Candidatus Moranbacteria bacterium]